MLSVRDVDAYYGNVQALFGVSLEVNSGEIVALIGANGAGKSTTLKSIVGLVKPASGTVSFLDGTVSGRPAYEILKVGIALCPEGRRVWPQLSVAEVLDLGAYIRKKGPEVTKDLEMIYEWFPILAERKHQKAISLSGGEQQMLAIGRALMSRPRLLLLDEPSLGLAPKLVEQVAQIIADINSRGTSILLVEQNAVMALNLADRAYVIETGRVTLEGKGQDLLNDDHVRAAYLGVATS
jgi:branched-chain amino acid transport system ATP-binding protein